MENYHLTKKDDHWQLEKRRYTGAANGHKKRHNRETMYLEGKIASLKIHGEDGKIRKERASPRSRSKEA